MRNELIAGIAAVALSFAAPAFAQEVEDPPVEESNDPNDGSLPPSQSDSDPRPEVASPGVPPGGIVKQAGIGGPTGYARAGVLELGGSAGLTFASDFRQINIAPQIGWFIADNLQLSAMIDIAHVGTDGANATIFTGLVEPSYHIPFNRSLFGFLGLGLGGSWIEDIGGGFALAPRVGANLMVGRSGVLTPSLSWQYTTHDAVDQGDMTLVAVSSALRLNVGYTVMW